MYADTEQAELATCEHDERVAAGMEPDGRAVAHLPLGCEAANGIVRGAPGSELSAMIFGEYFPNPAAFGTDAAARALVSPWHARASTRPPLSISPTSARPRTTPPS